VDRYVNQYRLDGLAVSTDRSTGLIASNGAASLAATHPRGQKFVAALWALDPPAGNWRYYNGLLQFMATLTSYGCDQVQGYHFAKPMPASEVAGFIEARAGAGQDDLQTISGVLVQLLITGAQFIQITAGETLS